MRCLTKAWKSSSLQRRLSLTGNPVRQNLLGHAVSHEEAVSYFSLNPSKKTILILGGSLGARTINRP